MTENLKLTREQQLAEWRKRQKQKSQQNLKTWGTRVKKDFLKMRLRFWGGILMVIGFMTSALNLMFLLGGEKPVMSAVLVGWGLVLLVVAIVDFVKVSTGMLTLTGVVTMIQGLFASLSGGLLWGPLFFVAGILMLKDASKARKQEKEQESAKQSPDPGDRQGAPPED